MKLNQADVNEWIGLCEWLETQQRKCSYRVPREYSHLISHDPIFTSMRKYLKENECDCIFYSSGWGWRLRKNWRNRIEKSLEIEN